MNQAFPEKLTEEVEENLVWMAVDPKPVKTWGLAEGAHYPGGAGRSLPVAKRLL